MIAGVLFFQKQIKKVVRYIVGYFGLLEEVALTAEVVKQSTTRPDLRVSVSLDLPKHRLEQY